MLFKTSKEIAILGLYIALLIASQYVLSAVKGIELVTVFLLCFAFSFGAIKGIICAIGFSLLRCFIFGFFPTVILLYLIYYPIFALVTGLLGNYFKKREKQKGVIAFVTMIITAVISTVLFSLLDYTINVIVYDYTKQAALAYFVATIPVMITQSVCALFSVAILFYPLTRILLKVNGNLQNSVKVR